MRLLLDNNLSARLIPLLASEGWDVVHLAQLGLRDADDDVVLEAARRQSRVLMSADTDFGALLAASNAVAPSIVLLRRVAGRRVEDLALLLVANLPMVEADLDAGCVVAIGEDNLRVRRLPIA